MHYVHKSCVHVRTLQGPPKSWQLGIAEVKTDVRVKISLTRWVGICLTSQGARPNESLRAVHRGDVTTCRALFRSRTVYYSSSSSRCLSVGSLSATRLMKRCRQLGPQPLFAILQSLNNMNSRWRVAFMYSAQRKTFVRDQSQM